MTTVYRRCQTDEEYAKVSVFLLEHKRDLRPSYKTMDMVTLLYTYLTEGHLIQVLNKENDVIGASVYFLGTRQNEYKDKEVAFVDVAVVNKAYRGTRLFINGLLYLINTIMKEHPQVEELRFVTLPNNKYLCRLYAKFMTESYIDGKGADKEVVFCGKIKKIHTTLAKYNKV